LKYLLIFLFLFISLHADKMKKKTLACPSVMQLQKAPLDTTDSYMDLSMYAIANDCVILGEMDKVEAVGYDVLNSKEIYQKIIYQKTGVYLYILRSSIQIEKDGKKSSFRF